MKRNYAILLVLSSTILVGCDRSVTPPVSCVQAEFSWDGATAEMIAELLPSLAPSMKLAIVEDGLATVYFDCGLNVVDSELESIHDEAPRGFTVRSIREIATGIPEPPEPVAVPRIKFEPDKDRMAVFGITKVALMSAISESIGSFSTVKNKELLKDPELFRSLQIKMEDGKMIPIQYLGRVEPVMAPRPLVLH